MVPTTTGVDNNNNNNNNNTEALAAAAAENLIMDGAYLTKGGRGSGGEVVDMTCGELLVLGRPTIAPTIGKALS